MSGVELLASLVDSLAWPVVVVVAVLILREPFEEALAGGALKALKVGTQGVEAEFFEAGVRRAEADLSPQPGAEGVVQGARSPLDGESFLAEMTKLAGVSPSAAVLESFARLEQVLRRSVGEDPSSPRVRGARQLGRLAHERGLLTRGEMAALDEVIALRNAVAHVRAEDLDPSAAAEYARVTLQIMVALLLANGETAYWPAES